MYPTLQSSFEAGGEGAGVVFVDTVASFIAAAGASVIAVVGSAEGDCADASRHHTSVHADEPRDRHTFVNPAPTWSLQNVGGLP